jgi:hypothetical protein
MSLKKNLAALIDQFLIVAVWAQGDPLDTFYGKNGGPPGNLAAMGFVAAAMA